MSRLAEIQREYEKVMVSEESDFQKDKHLTLLMTQMEKEFSIPMLQNKEWEEGNKSVIAMYRKLSMSRKTI